MSKAMITVGCVMGMVFEHDTGEILSSSEGEVRITYCHTTESDTNNLIVTPEMRQLGEAGYLPIAIARVQCDDVKQFRLFAVDGLSESLRAALELRGCDVVQNALSGSDGQNIPTVSN